MSLERLTTQNINALLNIFNTFSNTVFWVRSACYQQQLYVSPSYEKIWGRSCQSLYTYPNGWFDTLLPEDRQGKCLTFHKRLDQGGTGMVLFRIYRPNGEIGYIRDQSCLLIDNNQKPIAVVGVGECITPETWETLANNQTTASPVKKELPDFLKLITQTYQMQVAIQEPTDSTLKNSAGKGEHSFQFGQQQIKASHREMQTLHYLLQGYSAKQTAALLNISTRTVETYLEKLRKKTGSRSKLILISKVKLITTGREF